MRATGEIVRGEDLTSERIVTVDACVVGTGAGGAPVAAELAAAGLRVAMLEEGAWHDADTFTARPRDMAARLYRDGGQSATIIPSQVFGVADERGSIAVGKTSDLFLVDGDPSQRIGDLRRVEMVLLGDRLMKGSDLRQAAGLSGMPK